MGNRDDVYPANYNVRCSVDIERTKLKEMLRKFMRQTPYKYLLCMILYVGLYLYRQLKFKVGSTKSRKYIEISEIR